MGQKTYVFYKNKKYNWVDLLKKFKLEHYDGRSAHDEWDRYVENKKRLQSVEVVVKVKNDDGKFVEAIKNKDGVYIELIKENEKKMKNKKEVKVIKEQESDNESIEISNGRKRPTSAQLPNGEVISWVNLLKKFKLEHYDGRSAHDEWDEYFEYKKGLPNVKEVPKKGEEIYKTGNTENIPSQNNINLSRKSIDVNMKGLAWIEYIGLDVPNGLCFCCGKRQIHFTDYEVAHNKPRSKGGDETLGNIRPICGPCNKSMGNRYTIDEYIEIRGLKKN